MVRISALLAMLNVRGDGYSRQDERGLDLVGFIAFLDPPKESAAEEIRALHHHGVQVKIFTGDHDIIARQVCNQIGIDLQRVLTGPELAVMDTATLDQAVTESQLFARLNSQQKARVIEVLRAQGHVVGCLGDGIVVYLGAGPDRQALAGAPLQGTSQNRHERAECKESRSERRDLSSRSARSERAHDTVIGSCSRFLEVPYSHT